jgi:hypothetical protein
MKLATITARNFKGLSFSLSLTDITFIIGNNFAGKTARTDAIRFLLLGYLPELGKTNVASFGLSSGREMVVEGTFDNGLTIRRRRYLQGDSVKAEDDVPEQIEKSGQLAVMLNADTYFSLSDRERVAYVFANIPMAAEWTNAHIIDKVAATLTERFGNAPSTSKVIQSIDDCQRTAETPQAFLEVALSSLTGQIKDAKAYAAKMEGTIQGLAALRLADDRIVPMTTITAREEELNTAAESIRTQMSELKAAADQQRANSATRTSLQRQINAANTLIAALPALQAKHAAIPQLPEITEQHVLEAHTAHGRIQQELGGLVAHAIHLENQVKAANLALDTIASQTACPCCGASGEGWKVKRVAELTAQIESGTAAAVEARSTYETGCQQERINATHLRTMQANRKAYLETRDRIESHNAQIRQAEAAQANLDKLNETLATIPAEDPEITAKMDSLKTQLTVNARARDEVEQQKKAAIGRQQDLKRLAEAEKQRDDTKVDAEAITVAGKRLREIQAEMVKAAFTPLLIAANYIFGSILKSPIAYNEGEIGTWRAGVWVTHRTFSGTEKALTYAAIQAALTSKCPIRIMMIDELGRIATNYLEPMNAAFEAAVASGYIDQVVGIDAGRAPNYHEMTEGKNSQVIQLS